MNEMGNPNRQRGLSMTSWMVVIGIAVFFVVVGMKLIPTYIEHYSIKSVLKSIEDDSGSAQRSPREIRQTILKRLTINGVYEFDPNNIEIKKDKGRTMVGVDYEVRKNMMGNLDVIMSFQDQVSF